MSVSETERPFKVLRFLLKIWPVHKLQQIALFRLTMSQQLRTKWEIITLFSLRPSKTSGLAYHCLFLWIR